MTAERLPELQGRSGEHAVLDRLLDDARRGRCAVLVIRGEAGVGKTALLRHAAKRASAFRVAQIAGVESEMELPYAGLHLLCTLHGLPVGFALTGAKADERQVLLDILDDPQLTAGRARQAIIGDKNYYGACFENTLADCGAWLLRPARQGETARPGARFFKPLRQIIESVNATLKGQLDLERHGGRTTAGIYTRIAQRLLAMAACIWHNWASGEPVKRSLIAFDN